ncbi:AAA family ATPase [Bengtsoniella intestinalis]|uniref:ATP-binding protein n=1 Tax=Bengtsoniella intestinalis TaxID=3073143 RepID=UPI00391EFD07
MQGTFGRLQQQSLTISSGLNILQAPNESGKSTWCAFLLAMAYGINSRERDKAGFIAEKNRYAPWNGALMSGSMDCTYDGKAITVTRDTKRTTAPMANFTATFTGTGDQAGYLDGLSCGETLFGVSRDVFERSAFIRQAGLSIGQTPELERRIASLITTGDEDSAYSQVLEKLKQQRNRRRHNKTGLIPQYEAELATLEAQLKSHQDITAQYVAAQQLASHNQALVAQLEQALAHWDAFDAQQQHLALSAQKEAVNDAQQTAATLSQALQDDHIPENDVVARLRGAIVNLEFTRRQTDKAMGEKDKALRQTMTAQATLGESPFAGQSPEQAMSAAVNLPSVKPPSWIPPILLGIATGGGIWALTYSHPFNMATGIYALVAGLGLMAFTWGISTIAHKKKAKLAIDTYLKHHGVDTPEALTALAQDYTTLWDAHAQAIATSAAATAQYNGLYETLSTNEQAILLEVRRFAPTAFDVTTADESLRHCGARRKAVQVAQAAAREAQIRWEATAQDLPPLPSTALLERPTQPKDDLRLQHAQAQQALATTQHTMAQLEGQRTALGDSNTIIATISQHHQGLAQAEAEFSAVTTAMEALTTANTALQNRFAPQLGKATAQIFQRLTQGRYDGVILDRDLHLSTQVDGEALYRDIALLSAGAADQLYLATRLAICDLILPPDCPIILDDALTNFDDERCKIALDYLQEVAKTRQVLLFTCQARENQLIAKSE